MRLRESVVLNGERDVAAEKFESVEFAVFVERVAGAAAQSDNSGQTSDCLQRGEALEQFRRDVAIGTQEHGIRGGIQHNGTARRGERVHVFRKERNEGRDSGISANP